MVQREAMRMGRGRGGEGLTLNLFFLPFVCEGAARHIIYRLIRTWIKERR